MPEATIEAMAERLPQLHLLNAYGSTEFVICQLARGVNFVVTSRHGCCVSRRSDTT